MYIYAQHIYLHRRINQLKPPVETFTNKMKILGNYTFIFSSEIDKRPRNTNHVTLFSLMPLTVQAGQIS